MHTYADLALVLVVLAQTVIIWLWSRRARGLRSRLEAAAEAAGGLQRRLEATAEAATYAAVALAVDEEHDGDTDVTPAPPSRVGTPAETYEAPAAAPDGVAGAVEAGATATTPSAAAPADASPSAAVLLLLVEDDVNVARPYRMLLESRGYTVLHAADGVEGLAAARRERPDLLLLDVMMPRMNGITLLQALRDDANLRTIPAVMLSNYHEPRMVERAMALGALEYIVKMQMQPETLVVAIPRWLRGERVAAA
jgi:CheY-like chemotaxis protein